MATIAVTTLLAFALRGLTRFGSAMIGIGVLSTVLPPAQVVLMSLAISGLRPQMKRLFGCGSNDG